MAIEQLPRATIEETVADPRVGVWSEVGRLRRVMVCAPGLAHLRLTPDTCDELLYDDVIWVGQAKRDHYDFVMKMRDRGVEVLDMLQLLVDVVRYPEGRNWILDRKITDDQVGPGLVHEVRAWLESLPAEKLAEFLIGGVAFGDVPEDMAGPFLRSFRDADVQQFVLPPLPNTVFARDNSSWVYQGVTLNSMYWGARRQETLLTTAIYRFHPSFAGEDFRVWFGDPDQQPRELANAKIEVGDVMQIGNCAVVIGMGERT